MDNQRKNPPETKMSQALNHIQSAVSHETNAQSNSHLCNLIWVKSQKVLMQSGISESVKER